MMIITTSTVFYIFTDTVSAAIIFIVIFIIFIGVSIISFIFLLIYFFTDEL